MHLNLFLAFLGLSTFLLVLPQDVNCSENCSLDPWQGGKFGNPGARLRISEIALDYANRLANEKITDIIKSLRAPDARIGDLTIYGLKVVDFETPDYYRKLMKPNFVQWGFRQGQLSTQSGFSQIIRRPPFVNGQLTVDNITGIVTIASGSTSMDTSSTMVRDVEGRPSISSMTCDAKLGLLNVTFSGNLLSMPTYIQDLIVRQIQSVFEMLICSTARSLVMTAVNAELKTFPSKVPLDGSGLILDYSLLDNPRVTNDNEAIEGLLKGAVYIRDQPVYPFYPPNVWLNVTDNSTMIEFHLTSYLLNTLFYEAHQKKLLRFFATPQLMSPSSAKMLQLSCLPEQLCIGNIFGNSSSFGPQSYVTLSMQTTDSPKAMFNLHEGFWLGKGVVRMDVVDESKNSTKLLSADASCVFGSLNPRLYKNILFATTNITRVKLDKVESPLETLSDYDVAELERIVAIVLEELINGFFSRGFPIPLVDGVSMVQPSVQVLPGSIFVSSNFTYTP